LMIVGQLDVAIRAGATVTILLLAWLLLIHRQTVGRPALLFLPLAMCVAGFVSGNTPLDALRPDGPVAVIANTGSGFLVVFLWWFCLSCFDPRSRLGRGVLAVGLLWAALAAADRGWFGGTLANLSLSRLLVPLGFGIVGHLVWRLLAERRDDLIGQRRDARITVAILLGGMLFIDLTSDALFGFRWRPLAFSMAQNLMILAFGLWLAAQMLTVRPNVLTFAVGEARAFPLDRSEDQVDAQTALLHQRLSMLMETERAFLNPELTFATFAKRMGAPERSVRTMINHELGYDHFRAFLNQYRVAEAKRLLDEPSRADKLITVALDSGFSSLASFNRAFRLVEGCAPSAYRAASLNRQNDRRSRQQPSSEKRKAEF
jgi:AraC-like DNA-binding protein